ncbi:amidase family protein [Cellulosimicrobium funkei]|uniref:amidase family protein n=1 Tax=Cellulosimicrobium funkei TaxID=264251 RepID=UPI000AAFE6A1|nr:amidase family protein [Cellulosimicrobium funkei]
MLLRAGRLTSTQVTQAYLDRIDAFNGPFEVYGDNGGYNAFVRLDREGALAQAADADARLAAAKGVVAKAELPILLGIPFGIKDFCRRQGTRGQERHARVRRQRRRAGLDGRGEAL